MSEFDWQDIPSQELSALAWTVSRVMNDEPESVGGVALLAATARRFGYELQIRPVSMLGVFQHPTKFACVATGTLAMEHARTRVIIPVGAIDEKFHFDPEFQRAGHVVAVFEPGMVVLDPAFGQFERSGLPGIFIWESIHPMSKVWHVQPIPGMDLYYIRDDANTGWQERYANLIPWAEKTADEIVALLRGGANPVDVPFLLGYE